MENLTSLLEKSVHIGSCIHGASQDLRVLMCGLRLADETSKNPLQGDCLFESTARRGRRQCLQVKGQVVLDRG
jgi:hypothetical protein